MDTNQTVNECMDSRDAPRPTATSRTGQHDHAELGSRYLTKAIAAFESAGTPYSLAVPPLLFVKDWILRHLHAQGTNDSAVGQTNGPEE